MKVTILINFSNYYHKFVFGLEQINEASANYSLEFIKNIEDMFYKEICGIADFILNSKNKCKILMLAGPSSSGKTTTSYKLRDELIKRGHNTIIISLDDFYLGRNLAPISSHDGKPDFEAIEALDVPQLKNCLNSLINKGVCDVPKFDFKNKAPHEDKIHIELKEDDIVIIEGLHALNPMLTSNFSKKDGILKAYISVKQGINDYNGKILSRQDIRLIRRIARDYKSRGTNSDETFSMWDSVCRGEFFYIHPFKRTSDVTINSIHIYEPCVLSHQAIPLLLNIKEDSIHFRLANKLISSLERFYPIDIDLVPQNSLIREFIGGGIY